jgi:hypothetical protein
MAWYLVKHRDQMKESGQFFARLFVPGTRAPSIHGTGDWVGARRGMDVVTRRKSDATKIENRTENKTAVIRIPTIHPQAGAELTPKRSYIIYTSANGQLSYND